MENEFQYPTEYRFEINTGDIYQAVNEYRAKFSDKMLEEFNQRIQSALLRKGIEPDAPFYPTDWRYHRGKYIRWRDNKSSDPFELNFFLQPTNNYPKELSDEEWLSIVYEKRINVEEIIKPWVDVFGKSKFSDSGENKERDKKENEEYSYFKKLKKAGKIKESKASTNEYIDEISEEKKKEVLEKLKSGKYSISNDDNDPFQWSRWRYHIYSYYQKCELNLKQDRQDFEYFFAFKLELIDPFDVKLFLNWHLENTFNNSSAELKEFIDILFMKYNEILTDSTIKALSIKFTESNIILKQPEEKKSTLGKRTKDKLEIPITITRKPSDKITNLTAEQTAILFKYFKEEGIILKDDSLLSKVSMGKAIRALTGFNHDNLTDYIEKYNHNNKDKKEVLEYLEKVKQLINKDLK